MLFGYFKRGKTVEKAAFIDSSEPHKNTVEEFLLITSSQDCPCHPATETLGMCKKDLVGLHVKIA
jgi:hypothetical protein